MLYVHHVAVVLLAAQVLSVTVAMLRFPECRRAVGRWAWWLAGVLVAALPDLTLLAAQAASAGKLAPAGGIVGPWALLLGALIAYPTGLLLPVVAATLLVADPRRGGRKHSGAQPTHWMGGACLLFSVLLMTLASYRTNFLMVYLIMMLAPLGASLVGALLGRLVQQKRRIATAVVIEAVVAGIAVDAIVWRNFWKTNTDLAAHYVQAEASNKDLIILGPGALGASFNYYFTGVQSQLDLPFAGPVRMFPFDDHFARIADLGALHEAYDSIAAAVARGSDVWLLMPANWVLAAPQPERLDADRFEALGQSDGARVNLLRQRLIALLGQPFRVPFHSLDTGMELLTVERFRSGQRNAASQRSSK
jgi:hypothetical protein